MSSVGSLHGIVISTAVWCHGRYNSGLAEMKNIFKGKFLLLTSLGLLVKIKTLNFSFLRRQN